MRLGFLEIVKYENLEEQMNDDFFNCKLRLDIGKK